MVRSSASSRPAGSANNYFANAAGIPVLEQPFKNYGDSLGGPIRIPKVYDGRNKTFFFVTTEGYRMFDAATTVASVPTALERVGNFSQSLSTLKNGTQQLIYDPLSTNLSTGARTPFAGNIIPQSQLSPIGLALASYYPLPTLSSTPYYGAPNASLVVNVQDRADQGIFKVDHEATKWLKLSATYIHYGSTEPSNTFFPNPGTPGQTIYERHVDGLASNAVATLSPTTVLTVRFGQNRFPDFDPNVSNGFKLTQLGFSPAVNALTPGYPAFPGITTGEFTAYGGGNTPWTVYHSQSFDAEVAKFMGKHSIKAGFDYRLIADASETSTGPGTYGFTSGFTSASAAKSVTGSGGGLASMLLGDPASGSITAGSFFNDYTHYTAFYIQDDYRITPKLTLNFGFRGEHEPQPEETNNKLTVDANLNATNPLQASIPSLTLKGQVEYAGLNGNPRYAGLPLSMKLGPRFGFAYSMNPKTVFRGGYGIFWIPQSFSAQSAAGYSQVTSLTSSINGGYTPYANLSNPYPNGLTPIAGNSLGGLANIGNAITTTEAGNRSAGYVEQMSLDIQRQITKNASIWGGYIGSHTLDQPFTVALNQLNPSFFPRSARPGLNKSVANPFFGYAPNTGFARQRLHRHAGHSAANLSGIHFCEFADRYGSCDLLFVLRQSSVAGEVRPDPERDLHLVAQYGAQRSAELLLQHRFAGLGTGGDGYTEQLLDVGIVRASCRQRAGIPGQHPQGPRLPARRLVTRRAAADPFGYAACHHAEQFEYGLQRLRPVCDG